MTVNQNQVSTNDKQKVRYAVVGLGWIAQETVLPGFGKASENSELVAFVSDDSTKCRELGKEYGIERTYSYDEYDKCLNSGDIDAVYIALPNHLHCEYTVRAAQANIHVLCEKPMAVTEEECETMIRAANDHHVKLMIAYRLHFEKANMQAVEIVQSGQIGSVRIFNSVFSQQVAAGNVRLVKTALGGGPLYDMGIYCINAARYLFQDEPVEVFATSANNGEQRFSEVAEMNNVILRFPQERLATFTCSFGAASVGNYQVVGTEGDLRLDSAYDMTGEIKQQLTINNQTQERSFPQGDQFAAELIYFSDCVLTGKDPEPSGVEGLADVRIICALNHSAAIGKPVKLGDFQRQQRPNPAQVIQRPASEQPELIHAADPSGKS